MYINIFVLFPFFCNAEAMKMKFFKKITLLAALVPMVSAKIEFYSTRLNEFIKRKIQILQIKIKKIYTY